MKRLKEIICEGVLSEEFMQNLIYTVNLSNYSLDFPDRKITIQVNCWLIAV